MPGNIVIPNNNPWNQVVPQLAMQLFGGMIQNQFANKELVRKLEQDAATFNRMDEWKPSKPIPIMQNGKQVGVRVETEPGKWGTQLFHQKKTPPKPEVTEFGLIYYDEGSGKFMVDEKYKKIPGAYETKDTDTEGNVTITSLDKKTGKQNWQTSLGSLGKKGKSGTEVNVNLPNELTQKTKSDLQETIVSADQTLDALNNIDKSYRDEFSQYAGRGRKWLSQKADKLGVTWGSDFLRDYTEWASQVDIQTLLYRKFITGVAGSAEEMKAIEKTTINTKYDSPVQFRKKAEIMRRNTEIGKQRAQFSLEYFGRSFSELTPPQKKEVSKRYPLIFSPKGLEVPKTPDQEASDYLNSIQ